MRLYPLKATVFVLVFAVSAPAFAQNKTTLLRCQETLHRCFFDCHVIRDGSTEFCDQQCSTAYCASVPGVERKYGEFLTWLRNGARKPRTWL